jgi:hypothetical protein
MPVAKRKRLSIIGVISAHEAYTAAELTRRGWGPDKRAAMRESGKVRPRNSGNARWYLGSEVLEWMKVS